MAFQLVCIEPKELTQYKSDMQEAFQKGFEDAFGKTDAVILPEKDIDQSVNAEGSAVYKAVVDGEMVGGAVVIINESTQHNHLDLLFVKNGVQSKGCLLYTSLLMWHFLVALYRPFLNLVSEFSHRHG